MAFPTDEIALGPATFGRRKGTEGICWHTTEAADESKASALSTVRWQLANPGSYGFIIFDGGILLTVPFLEASGGINPGSQSWAPERFPFLKQQLSPAAYADPNAYLINVAFSGKTAVFRDKGLPDNMRATAKQLTEWAEDLFGRPMVHCGHMHWQTNRSDPSQRVLDAITAQEEPDVYEWVANIKRIDPVLVTFRPETAYRERPDLTPESEPRWFPDQTFTRLVIGTVEGAEVNGSKTWLVLQTAAGRLNTAHSQDEIGRKPVGGGTTQDNAFGFAVQREAVGLLGEIDKRAGELRTAVQAASTQIGSKKP